LREKSQKEKEGKKKVTRKNKRKDKQIVKKN